VGDPDGKQDAIHFGLDSGSRVASLLRARPWLSRLASAVALTKAGASSACEASDPEANANLAPGSGSAVICIERKKIMKRIHILVSVLCACVVFVAWSQQPAGTPPMSKRTFHHHRSLKGLLMPTGTARDSGVAPQAAAQNKAWELGTYPGGTWAAMGDINDFGVAVGQGDLPDGSTSSLAISLFGPRARKWIDLGTLGGTYSGWEDGIISISNTGVIVGHSATADNNRAHGFVWTENSGLVDLGTLADIGYPTYNSSYAAAVNKLGTLIAGWSGIEESCIPCAPTLPVVWTPAVVWTNGVPAIRWKIQKLNTDGFDETTYWYVWAVNDFGQIVGEANSQGGMVGVLWTPLPSGKGWKLTRLPDLPGYPATEPFNINDRGEITGNIEPAEFSVWVPAYWKPLDPLRQKYSPPIVLALPEGGFTNGYTDGINELGDMTGECWGDGGDQAVRWTTQDTTFSQVLGFPGDFSWSFRVNNDRIAVVTYGGGDKCPADTTCGGAIQIK
jgi:probable HAF family extracellular repeat protein